MDVYKLITFFFILYFSVPARHMYRNRKYFGRTSRQQRRRYHGLEAVGNKSTVSAEITSSNQNTIIFSRFRLLGRHVEKGQA